MPIIEWNQGLQTGIDAIDSDHRILLNLINELFDALQAEATDEVIQDAFYKLGEYTEQHFAAEERLMHKAEPAILEAHKQQHALFINEIDKLKQSLFTSDSTLLTEDVLRFLTEWVVNHIVEWDSKLIPLTLKNRESTQSQKWCRSIRQCVRQLGGWLSAHIPFQSRVWLAALVPTAAMLLFSIFTIWGNLQKLDETRQLDTLFKLVNDSGELIHHLQAERGMSIGIINSSYAGYVDQLAEIQSRTDEAAQQLQNFLSEQQQGAGQATWQQHQNLIQLRLQEIEQQRQLMTQQAGDSEQLRISYTAFIRDLLGIADQMVHVETSGQIGQDLLANISLMHLKERVGLTRALGLKAIELRQLDGDASILFLKLLGEQQGYLDTFYRTASPGQIALWEQQKTDTAYATGQYLVESFLSAWQHDNLGSLNGGQWWEAQTRRMDSLHQDLQLLAEQVAKEADSLQAELKRQITVYTAGTLAWLLLCYFGCHLLIRSVTQPVSKLTQALKRLSMGDSTYTLHDKLANDDLGQMSQAYELCRTNFLKFGFHYSQLQLSTHEAERYKKLSGIDPLTKNLNRRRFFELGEKELERSQRYHRPLSLIMFDIDHFKQVNDTYGHQCGDRVLATVSALCRNQLRDCDIMGRLGGEEFAILLPETSQPQAIILAERLREAIAQASFGTEDTTLEITVSLGVTEWQASAECQTLEQLLAQADAWLYQAKSQGRNQACAA